MASVQFVMVMDAEYIAKPSDKHTENSMWKMKNYTTGGRYPSIGASRERNTPHMSDALRNQAYAWAMVVVKAMAANDERSHGVQPAVEILTVGSVGRSCGTQCRMKRCQLSNPR